MALTLRYANFDLATGSNDGTSEANAWQSWSAMASGYAAGQHVYFKRTSSRHDAGSTITMSTAVGAAAPVVLEGYSSTPGDGGDNGEGNYFQFANSIVLPRGFYVKYFDGAGQPATASSYLIAHTGMLVFYRCRLENTRTDSTLPTITLDDEVALYGCTVVAPQGQAAVWVEDAGLIYGCRIDMANTSANGIEVESDALRYQYVIANMIMGASAAGKGIYSDTYTAGTIGKYRLIYANSIHNVAQGIELAGVHTAAGTVLDLIAGNVVYGCATGIGNLGSNTAGVNVLCNAVGDCSVARYAGFGDNPTSVGDVTLTANPWNDAANWDFRINDTSGGGAEIAGLLLPDPIGDGSTNHQQHYGAVQAQVAAAAVGAGWSGVSYGSGA